MRTTCHSTYIHSVSGGLAVGNYDDVALQGLGGLPYGPGQAFIYNVATGQFLAPVTYPGSKSNSLYAIWHNGGTSYTLAGGYSNGFANNFANQDSPIGNAFLVDYDSATGKFSHWTTFVDPSGKNLLTHFQGLSSVESGVYTIAADSAEVGTGTPAAGSFVTVVRKADGSFGAASWYELNYQGYDPTTSVTSADAVLGNAVVGPVIGPSAGFNYQAEVNFANATSNIISGNGGNGIELSGASNNQIAQNYIGTDVTGMQGVGNLANGILITATSKNNMIGGTATDGNDPTNGVFVMPALGNVISGNGNDGVLINGKATGNQLSGNFVGTEVTGNADLANSEDGVAIVNANGNSLIGCSFTENPFVYYNVLSGNDGNGLVVDNSNHTTIQGNFFGLGADNNTPIGNLYGVVVEGASAHTTMGGPTPLGNVAVANQESGILLKDKVSYFTAEGTFSGVSAFGTQTNLGNQAEGILVTATGGHNLLRNNVISENVKNGIEISGAAHGVSIVGNLIGLKYDGTTAMGNGNDGIQMDGSAHDIFVGGPQSTLDGNSQNTISGNGLNGVEIAEFVHSVTVNHSFIGTDVSGLQAIGNAQDGINVSASNPSVTIGSLDPALNTVISGNTGNGIQIALSDGNRIMKTKIGTNVSGTLALGNGADGIAIEHSSNTRIGSSSVKKPTANAPNIIAFNGGSGVSINLLDGNSILGNSIYENASSGIEMTRLTSNRQAAPVLNSVQTGSQGIQVTGTLSSTPKTMFTIEFFANTTNSASGRVFLGSKTVKTDANGLATFTYLGPLPPAGANFITATATDPGHNTSEFSAGVA